MNPIATTAPRSGALRGSQTPGKAPREVSACDPYPEITPNPETAEYLDGPGFAEWLQANGVSGKHTLGKLERRFTGWKKGEPASIFHPDELLTRTGLHIALIPHCLYRGAPSTNGGSG